MCKALGQRARARDGEVHARYRPSRATPAFSRSANTRSIDFLRPSIAGLVVLVVAEGRGTPATARSGGAAVVDQPAQGDSRCRCPSRGAIAGWISSADGRGVRPRARRARPTGETRSPVSASAARTGVGVERARDVGDRRQLRRGRRCRGSSVICAPGLKPSLRFRLARVDVHAARVGGIDSRTGARRAVRCRSRRPRASARRSGTAAGTRRIRDLAALRVRRVHGDRCRAGRSAVATAAAGRGEGPARTPRTVRAVAGPRARAKDAGERALTRGNLRPGRPGRQSKSLRRGRPALDGQALARPLPSVASTARRGIAALASAPRARARPPSTSSYQVREGRPSRR